MFAGQGETLYVAMEDPNHEGRAASAANSAGLPTRPMIASPPHSQGIRIYYQGITSTAPSQPAPRCAASTEDPPAGAGAGVRARAGVVGPDAVLGNRARKGRRRPRRRLPPLIGHNDDVSPNPGSRRQEEAARGGFSLSRLLEWKTTIAVGRVRGKKRAGEGAARGMRVTAKTSVCASPGGRRTGEHRKRRSRRTPMGKRCFAALLSLLRQKH